MSTDPKALDFPMDESPAAADAPPAKGSMLSFYFVVFYLVLEFARPQTAFPPLQLLHLPAIAIAAIALSLIFSGKLHLKDGQTLVFLLFLIEMVGHGPFAVNNYWAFNVFYSMAITFIAYLGIVAFVDTDEKFDLLIKYWLVIFIFLAIYGYFNANLHLPKYMRYGMGVGGFLGDANDYCMALNTILPFAIFGIFTSKSALGKFYFIALICLFLFIIILTESRGGFIGMVTVGFYSWLRSNRKFLLAAVIAVLVLFVFAVAPSGYWDEIQSIKTENTDKNPYGTGAQRVYSWKLGWAMFKMNPVVGVGQGNYPWRVGEVEDKMNVDWKTRSIKGRAAHSLYFTLFPEMGLLGTSLFGTMVFLYFKELNRIKRLSRTRSRDFKTENYRKHYYLALALEGSAIGFLVSSIFISTLYYPVFWVYSAFVLALKKIVVTLDT